MPTKLLLSMVFTLAIIFPTYIETAFGKPDNILTTLTADDAGVGDHYGFSLDSDGHWLAVGAKYAGYGGSDTGVVYIYSFEEETGDWQFVQKLVPDDGIALGEFGESVAISHNHLLVGARSMLAGNGQQSGKAYLYTYQGYHHGWSLEAAIEPFDGKDGDEFGRSVALGPNRLIVGARFASNARDERTGGVYVYYKRANTWQLEKKITDPDGRVDDQFGRSLCYDYRQGSLLAIGSRNGSIDGVTNQGKVLIYTAAGTDWLLSQTIASTDGEDGDYFGQSIALAHDHLVIGARNARGEGGDDTGAAYIYRRESSSDTWTLEQKISAPDGKKKAQFGFAVEIDRQTSTKIAVSARRADSVIDKKTGAVYLYSYTDTENKWSLDQKIVPETLAEDDEFGQSLAMNPFGGSWLFIGADQSALSGNDKAGALYLLKDFND